MYITKDLFFKFIFGAIQIVLVLSRDVYTNQFIFHSKGGPEKAKTLAEKHGLDYLGEISSDHYHLLHKRIARHTHTPSHIHHEPLHADPEIVWFSQQKLNRRVKRDLNFNDKEWDKMWYLNRGKGLDMNVKEAWELGYTGKNVVVTILDDGLETDHPDLVKNYDPAASYDVNNLDPDPQPRYDITNSNRHGTRCAGEVAATANNTLCSVGVAYDAGIGGVRMLDGDVTDAVEARSISFNFQHIDIYSASWGPDDDGKTVDGPGHMASEAFENGIKQGRSGLGSIFVWASGNGGRLRDNCNCDGYTNSIWTLSISSATENGLVPWYSEACSSTLATTYSSGSVGERQIVTTDLHNSCTTSHTGTSASAPLAAGICALALEANPSLTWRDMQHLVVRTSRPTNLIAHDWRTNGVGRNVSHSYGYGMMDAGALVKLARSWSTVPPQTKCHTNAKVGQQHIQPRKFIEVLLDVHCTDVMYAEHVQAVVSLSSTRRGDIVIYLTSPLGTRSTLLDRRPQDSSRTGFKSWPFLSVHYWGENPNGVWKLEVHSDGKYVDGSMMCQQPDLCRSTLTEWKLIVHGTKQDPERWKKPEISQASKPKETGQHEVEEIMPQSKVELEDYMNSENGIPLVQPVCKGGLLAYRGHCVKVCPEGCFNVSSIKSCVPCHYSCKSCFGSNDYECLSCYGDAVLEKKYCLPSFLMNQLRRSEKWNKLLVIIFVFALVVFATIGVFSAWRYYKNSSPQRGYTKLQNKQEFIFKPHKLPLKGTIISQHSNGHFKDSDHEI